MNILLDTQVLLWLAVSALSVSARARALLEAQENKLFLSSISVWEIEQKFRSGKLKLPLEPRTLITEFYDVYDIASLPFDEESAFVLEKLPRLHGDPFDRMLVCQAIQHGLTIITSDKHIHQYPVRTIW